MVYNPASTVVLLTLLKDDKGMNTLLSDDIKGRTESSKLIRDFVKELEATGNADAMQELLEEKYSKDFKTITKRLDTDSTYALMDNIWENLIKYKKAIDKKPGNPKIYRQQLK